MWTVLGYLEKSGMFEEMEIFAVCFLENSRLESTSCLSHGRKHNYYIPIWLACTSLSSSE